MTIIYRHLYLRLRNKKVLLLLLLDFGERPRAVVLVAERPHFGLLHFALPLSPREVLVLLRLVRTAGAAGTTHVQVISAILQRVSLAQHERWRAAMSGLARNLPHACCRLRRSPRPG